MTIRYLLSALALVAPAGHAAAQSSDWSGYYVGASGAQVGGRNGHSEATIDPARDSRFAYSVAPTGRSFSRERNLESATAMEGRAGRLFETGGWVWGIEAQVGTTDLTRTFAIGPINAGPVSGSSGSMYVIGTIDTLTADLETGRQASLRARVGHPIGNRVLVSTFVGPSALKADIALRQNSTLNYNTLVFGCTPPIFCPALVPSAADRSVATRETRTVTGGTAGIGLDVKLSEQWIAHAEGSLSRYDAIEVTGPANGGSGSRFSYETELYAASLGLIYRF